MATNYTEFYPGDRYVDWIAADAYSRKANGRPWFQRLFGSLCGWAQRQDSGKPVMVAETGSGNKVNAAAKGKIQAEGSAA